MSRVNLSMKQKQTQRHREQICGCQGEGRWGRGDGEFGISRGSLVYIDWMNDEVLLCSTGNHIPSPIKIIGERNVENNTYTHTYIYN